MTDNQPSISTRAATYKVIINTLKGLPNTKLDAAWGLTGLVSLYVIRIACDKLTKRFPRRGMYQLCVLTAVVLTSHLISSTALLFRRGIEKCLRCHNLDDSSLVVHSSSKERRG